MSVYFSAIPRIGLSSVLVKGHCNKTFESTEPSITDKTQYRPDRSLVSAASGGAGLMPPSAYMYPDGDASDMSPLPIGMKKGADLAEVSSAVREQSSEVQTELDRVGRRIEREKRAREASQASGSVSGASSSPADSAS